MIKVRHKQSGKICEFIKCAGGGRFWAKLPSSFMCAEILVFYSDFELIEEYIKVISWDNFNEKLI